MFTMDPRHTYTTTKHPAVTEEDLVSLRAECNRHVEIGGVTAGIAADIKRVSLGLEDLMQEVRAYLTRRAA